MNIFILTGSIATGKSHTLKQLKRMGFRVLNADQIVHQLLAPGGAAVAEVAALFPETLVTEKNIPSIDRKALGNIVFNDARKLKQLENILHPLVRKAECAWLKHMRGMRAKHVVIEIPLYFESRWRVYERKNYPVIVTTATPWLQKKRALSRPHMTEEKLRSILKRQWPTPKKIAHANLVVHTGLGKAHALRQLNHLLT